MAELEVIDLGDPADVANPAPVRKLVNMVLLLAIKDGATELHFQPQLDWLQIIVRVEGALVALVPPPRSMARSIIQVLKIMAGMDILRSDRIRRGFLRVKVGEFLVDMVVSVQPTPLGESALVDLFTPAGASEEAWKVLKHYLERE